MEEQELIAKHTIPAPVEVVPVEMVKKMNDLLEQSKDFQVTDENSMGIGNGMVMEVHKLAKAVEDHRKALKKPVTELGKLIDSISKKASIPLTEAKRKLQGKLLTYQREQERIAAEARAKAEEEQRKAEAEARAKAEAEAAEKAKEAEELSAILGKVVEPEPVHVEPVKVATAPVPEPPKATAIQTRKVKELEITDPDLVPVSIGMVEIRPINRAALKKALLEGAQCPGAKIIEVEQVAMGRG